MRLGIISDIHLEFRDVSFAISLMDYLNEFKDKIDFLIIAGDIHPKKMMRDYFFSQLEIPYKYVLGNHDYYRATYYQHKFDENGIVGVTLWTNFNEDPLVEWNSRTNIMDFHKVYGIDGWSSQKCKDIFYEELKFIFQSKSEIVVTHFPPSLQCVAEKFKGNILNSYFCNNLDDMIRESNKKLWICGHDHNIFDFMIGDCRIVENSLGYPNERKNMFELKIIEI